VIDTAKDNQTQLQDSKNQDANLDHLALKFTIRSNSNNHLESQKVIEQRKAILKFLAEELKHLADGQSNIGSSKLMGSLTVPNSLIQVDLAALGITSLQIVVSTSDQNAASLSSLLSHPSCCYKALMMINPTITQLKYLLELHRSPRSIIEEDSRSWKEFLVTKILKGLVKYSLVVFLGMIKMPLLLEIKLRAWEKKTLLQQKRECAVLLLLSSP
jgi:hypothetical protein